MALAAIGGLLSAGGQIAGGYLGQTGTSSPRESVYNPNLDLALQAGQFDSLNTIGFGNINKIPSPYQQLVDRLNSVSMPSKTRNKVLSALNNIRTDPSARDDPFGRNFSPQELKDWFQRGDTPGAPSGRQGQYKKGEANGKWETWTSMPIEGVSALSRALKGTGLNIRGLKDIFAREDEFQAQIKRLNDAGLGKLNEQTILSRANAAATAAQLTGGAADFAKGGNPSGLNLDIFNRDEKQMQELESRLGMMANFGGINPATMFESLTDAKLDQNLRLIEQQLGMSNALSAALNPGIAASSGAGAASSGGTMNAVQIAAQQAQAANSIRAQTQSNNATSMANGVAGGLGSLGSSIGNYSLMQQLNSLQTQNLGGSSNYTAGLNFSGPGSTGNQIATQNARYGW